MVQVAHIEDQEQRCYSAQEEPGTLKDSRFGEKMKFHTKCSGKEFSEETVWRPDDEHGEANQPTHENQHRAYPLERDKKNRPGTWKPFIS